MDQAGIVALETAIDRVEAAVERVAPFGRHRRPQPHRRLRRLERHRVDGGEQRGCRDHQRELRIHAPGQAGQERRRQEHRHQNQRDADDRAEQFVHRADRRVVPAHALLDIVRGALDHHDGVVDHDADGEHDREQRREIHREADRPHHGEGADDGDRHRRRRHQHGAPVLEKDQDHDQHQHRRLDQRLVDFVDRGIDEHRGVERNGVDEALRESLRQLRHFGFDLVLDLERIGAGRLIDADAGRLLAVEAEKLAVGLGAELDVADVAQPRDLAVIPGLDDDVLVLLDVAEPALQLDGVLEVDAGRRRRHADLAGRHFLALLLQRRHDVLRVEAARFELFRIEPDPHRILAGAEHIDVADAGQPRQLVPKIDGGVIGEIEAVVAVVRRRQGDEQQDRRRALLHRDALRLHRLRQGRQRARDTVLHQDLRGIEIGADLEGHGERVGAVAGAGRLHVDHVLDAVDLLLDRQRHRIHHRARAGAGIARRHLHGRRHDVGILRDRQPVERDRADQNHQDGENVRQNRTLDEEFRDHRRSSRYLAAAAVRSSASTFWPGMARMMPPTTTRSSLARPLSMTRRSPTNWPGSTLRCSTTLSLLTTRT